MRRILIIIVLLTFVVPLLASGEKSYYFKRKTIERNLYNHYLSIGYFGHSNHDLEWGAVSYALGYRRFSVSAQLISKRFLLTDPYHLYLREDINSDWELAKDIPGDGYGFGILSLKANLYSCSQI